MGSAVSTEVKQFDITKIPVLQVRKRIVCNDLNKNKINLFATLYSGRLIYK